MAQRIDELEQRLATARAFIEPAERPQVEQAAVSEKAAPKPSRPARRKKRSRRKE
jgi:hypothetical protein